MTINVLACDIDAARPSVKAGDPESFGHSWHNPLAIALERNFGGYAVVTPARVHIQSPIGNSGIYNLSSDGRNYLRAWQSGKAEPCAALYVAVP